MTRWEELTTHERAALRHLAKGEIYDVPGYIMRRLRELDLVDDPDGHLSPAGLQLYLAKGRRTARSK